MIDNPRRATLTSAVKTMTNKTDVPIANSGDRENRAAEILSFILQNVEEHPGDVVRLTGTQFGISRQMANVYVDRLVADGRLEARGRTRARQYALRRLIDESFDVAVTPTSSESEIWRKRVRPLLSSLRASALGICQYGATEMLNNAFEHSAANTASVSIALDALHIGLVIKDDGIGIFNKIAGELGLEDSHVALLELSKGRLTTAPALHTGEGIYFTSRLFDRFTILSGSLFVSHSIDDDRGLVEAGEAEGYTKGTTVRMMLRLDTARTLKSVFDRFASAEGDYTFSRTNIPVRLASYEEEHLISRSQARRLLSRLDQFREVVLDFDGVDLIGQAFADEVFRVFASQHPGVVVQRVRANDDVERMIRRAQSGAGGTRSQMSDSGPHSWGGDSRA